MWLRFISLSNSFDTLFLVDVKAFWWKLCFPDDKVLVVQENRITDSRKEDEIGSWYTNKEVSQ